jgi:hypothetical protein
MMPGVCSTAAHARQIAEVGEVHHHSFWPALHAVPYKVLASVHATCIGSCVRRAQQGTRANKEAGKDVSNKKS